MPPRLSSVRFDRRRAPLCCPRLYTAVPRQGPSAPGQEGEKSAAATSAQRQCRDADLGLTHRG
jgi:hypothetical protein